MINKIPTKIIDIEVSIKLLDYLKREKVIDDDIYNYCISILLKKENLEKKKINSLDNYKILS